MSFKAWTTVTVRGRYTASLETFRVRCLGGFAAICTACQHTSLVTPNIHHALLCTHCQQPLTLPLDAHFACPATLEPQFSILEAFDIEADTSNDIVVGFADVTGVQNGGIWASVVRLCSRQTSSSRRVLAVMSAGMVRWYVVRKSLLKGELSFELVDRMRLGTHTKLVMHGSGRRVVVQGMGTAAEMDVGSRIVADLWFHELAASIRRSPHGPASTKLAYIDDSYDGYTSSGLDDDSHEADDDAETIFSMLDAAENDEAARQHNVRIGLVPSM
ncbi:hypothetical protein DL89DRAFT_291351 [Linderina pennispora]|uniref:Uncharacterized protein n=1 Tax=Linderina pennispora TaxID=61395 RepID=A0A1Y1WF16_9FUNG|nr:uncharacterized protein DL89DRAFT_291351 [Linderina pennispora]ORX72117.1 hypothetical protein DL89DRAFT_291351 [Linderina pennispora]